MNISQLGALTNLLSKNPLELKAIIKLASMNVLQSLGSNKYTVQLNNQTLTAQSDKSIDVGSRYWTQLSDNKDGNIKLSNLVKMPKLFQLLQSSHTKYSLEDLKTILSAKEPAGLVKQNVLEHLSTASSKDEFSNTSTLLLSLQSQTLTIPVEYKGHFSILQMKKRYNKRSKKAQIEFYAALELLGPISGVISLEENEVFVNISVAFEKTKDFLDQESKNFSLNLNISLIQDIEPLYEFKTLNSILDLSI